MSEALAGKVEEIAAEFAGLEPRERLELFAGGIVAVVDDFRRAEVTRAGQTRRKVLTRADKGHEEELRQFVRAVQSGGPMPISLEELALSSLVTIVAGDSIRSGRAERVDLAEVC